MCDGRLELRTLQGFLPSALLNLQCCGRVFKVCELSLLVNKCLQHSADTVKVPQATSHLNSLFGFVFQTFEVLLLVS